MCASLQDVKKDVTVEVRSSRELQHGATEWTVQVWSTRTGDVLASFDLIICGDRVIGIQQPLWDANS